MKRLVSMILVLILCLSLCACGSKKPDSEVVNTPAVGGSEGNNSIVNPEPVQPVFSAGIYNDADEIDVEEYWEGNTFMLYKLATDLGYYVVPSYDLNNPNHNAVFSHDGLCIYGSYVVIHVYLTATNGKMYHLVLYPYGDLFSGQPAGDYYVKIRENESFNTWDKVEDRVLMPFVKLMIWARFSRDVDDLPCAISYSEELKNLVFDDNGAILGYACEPIEGTRIDY